MRSKQKSLGLGLSVIVGLMYAGCGSGSTECSVPSDCPAQSSCDILTGTCVALSFDSGAVESCTAPSDCAPSGETCTPEGECRPGSCKFYGCVQGYSCRPVQGVFQCASGDGGVPDGSDAGSEGGLGAIMDAAVDQSTMTSDGALNDASSVTDGGAG